MTEELTQEFKTYAEIRDKFISDIINEGDVDLSIYLLQTLDNLVLHLNEFTMQGFLRGLQDNIKQLFIDIKTHPALQNRTILTLRSITEIYLHLITKHIRGLSEMKEIKRAMIKVSSKLLENFETAKDRIFPFTQQIIKDGDVG